MIIDVFADAILDALKMLPFLFGAFLVIEALEHHATKRINQRLVKAGKAGPAVGALLGCIPQCGFSVVAANLYAGGIVSLGTLLSVFIATSDEAVLILMGNPGRGREILDLLLVKIVIGIVAGYGVDIFFRGKGKLGKEKKEICMNCGCHKEHRILVPALKHTFQIFFFLFLFTGLLNLTVELLGIEKISEILLADTIFQPFIAAAVGLIPNCASSVILTQLYLEGVISFASVTAGLCTGAGLGLAVLCKMNRGRWENVKILGMLYGIAAAAGIVLQIAV